MRQQKKWYSGVSRVVATLSTMVFLAGVTGSASAASFGLDIDGGPVSPAILIEEIVGTRTLNIHLLLEPTELASIAEAEFQLIGPGSLSGCTSSGWANPVCNVVGTNAFISSTRNNLGTDSVVATFDITRTGDGIITLMIGSAYIGYDLSQAPWVDETLVYYPSPGDSLVQGGEVLFVTPEPGTVVMVLTGLIGLGIYGGPSKRRG